MSEFNAWTSKGDLEEGRYQQHLYLHQNGEIWKTVVSDLEPILQDPSVKCCSFMYILDPQKNHYSLVGDHNLQVREDDAWMKSTAVVNKEERESLFKVVAEMPQLSKLDLTGMNVSLSAHTSLLYQDNIIP